MKSSKPHFFLLLLFSCLCLLVCSACASGVEEDEDGGVWDFNNNTYTDPYGNVHEITPEGVQEDNSDNGGNGTVENPDGSITVITPDQDSNVQQNPDGSIVAVLLNPGTKKLYINLRMEDRCYPVELPAGGVMTAFMNAVK